MTRPLKKGKVFHAERANIAALAHKIYVASSWDEDWVTLMIAWAIIYNIEENEDEEDRDCCDPAIDF